MEHAGLAAELSDLFARVQKIPEFRRMVEVRINFLSVQHPSVLESPEEMLYHKLGMEEVLRIFDNVVGL